ncbi:MAG: hypothetical protein V7K98_16365 [Nostoc sp.]|uniref:hypothetical protein n=1 Tax=Nostoc sp. TaxID=1180 RepID=UPI002FF82421
MSYWALGIGHWALGIALSFPIHQGLNASLPLTALITEGHWSRVISLDFFEF